MEVCMRAYCQVSLAVLCALLFALTGCARINFYSDEEMKTKVGVKHYIAKPYLLVQYTGAEKSPYNTSIIYLPDLAQPVFAELSSGYGSSDLSISTPNGILTSVGQKSDTKGPETLNSLAAIGTSAAALIPPLVAMGVLNINQDQLGNNNKKLIIDNIQKNGFALYEIVEPEHKGAPVKLRYINFTLQ